MAQEKAALEAEIESLSQALFEEVGFDLLASLPLVTYPSRQIKWWPLNVLNGQRLKKNSKRPDWRKKL